MIKLRPGKSRKAVIAYLFAIFSPSPHILPRKTNTKSPAELNSEMLDPSGTGKKLQSPSGIINGSARFANIGTIAAKTTTAKTTGTNSSSIVTYKSSYSLWFSRTKIDFLEKWSSISTRMTWNFQKMTKIYSCDNQSFYKHELKYTVIFFLYN